MHVCVLPVLRHTASKCALRNDCGHEDAAAHEIQNISVLIGIRCKSENRQEIKQGNLRRWCEGDEVVILVLSEANLGYTVSFRPAWDCTSIEFVLESLNCFLPNY